VPLRLEIPGRAPLEFRHALFDVNGTLTNRGALIEGVAPLLTDLASRVSVQLLSADTFGTLSDVAADLGAEAHAITSGKDKQRVVEEVGADACIAVGNGRNDVPMLRAAALSIAIVGPEGASAEALAAADLVCRSAVEALQLLLDERALAATLRS
jgi:P-type E1-E2 ATPase